MTATAAELTVYCHELLEPRRSLLPSSRAPRTLGYRPRPQSNTYTLQSPPRRSITTLPTSTSPRWVLGIGPRKERTGERASAYFKECVIGRRLRSSCVLQKEIGRSSAKLCTETGTDKNGRGRMVAKVERTPSLLSSHLTRCSSKARGKGCMMDPPLLRIPNSQTNE